jgi:hypothetical protein
MTFADGWTCRTCWMSNRQRDQACYRCKTPRDADESEIEARRAAVAEAAEKPEKVPDIVVALPVVIFRGYSRVWIRGGIGVLGLLAILAFGGVTDVGYLLLTGVLGAGLIVIGFLSREASDAMRDREPWAFVVGALLSVVAVVASVMAFEILAPGLVNPTAVRWGSVIVFGGAGVAAIAGLVLMVMRRD